MLGAEDYLKPFSTAVWVNAMLEKSEPLAPFYPVVFKAWADTVLRQDFNMDQQSIKQSDCQSVYLHLVTHPSSDSL